MDGTVWHPSQIKQWQHVWCVYSQGLVNSKIEVYCYACTLNFLLDECFSVGTAVHRMSDAVTEGGTAISFFKQLHIHMLWK